MGLRTCKSCSVEKDILCFEISNGKTNRRHICKECRCAAKRVQYQQSNIKYSHYRQSAKNRGHSFELTFDEFETFWQKPCSYCGDSIRTIGIDRIDSSIGYRLSNCRAACEVCNKMKLNYTEEFWRNHMKKVLEKTNAS